MMPDRQDPTRAITFLYYRDLPTAEAFWRRLGLPLVMDQDFAKVFQIAGAAHVGLVDEAQGMNRWHEAKPVQVSIHVPDVDVWHEWAQDEALPDVSEIFENDKVGFRAFVFNDTEGYQVEILTMNEGSAP